MKRHLIAAAVKNKRPILIAILAVFVCTIVLFEVFSLQKEVSLRINVTSGERPSTALEVYDSYIALEPGISSTPVYGHTDAPILMLVYLDVGGKATSDFVVDLLPQIEKTFIASGKVKVYFRQHVTPDDEEQMNMRFKNARAFSCLTAIAPGNYTSVFMSLSTLPQASESVEIDVEKAIQSMNLSGEDFINCMGSAIPRDVKQDLLYLERSGFTGMSPITVIGVGKPTTAKIGTQSFASLNRTISVYQRQIGD